MRSCLLLLGVLVGCSSTPRGVPDGAPPDLPVGVATTITITTGVPAALVAFRDGVAGAWQAATKTTATSFTAQVHGPYLVSVVCDDTFTNPGGTFHSWDTWQVGRTLDDPHDYATCDATASHTITGHMVQAGTIVLGDAFDSSATANWNPQLLVANGTYDLIATTSDGFAIQRGVAVTGDLALGAAIDVAKQGTPYTTAAFTVTNAEVSESLRAAVFLETGHTPLPANLYNGAPGTAKVAPDAGLLASDSQTVSLRAFTTTAHGTLLRSFRRAFRVGGNTSYTLPAPLGNPQWTVTGTQAELAWTALPVTGALDQTINGQVAGGAVSASGQLDLTPSFVAATAPTKAVIDTSIPGFQPEWRVDTTASYSRQMTIQHIENGEVTSLSIEETL